MIVDRGNPGDRATVRILRQKHFDLAVLVKGVVFAKEHAVDLGAQGEASPKAPATIEQMALELPHRPNRRTVSGNVPGNVDKRGVIVLCLNRPYVNRHPSHGSSYVLKANTGSGTF